MEQKTNLKKDLGLFIATAMVAGNMMGSGIFMLPATLANNSGPLATISAWLITALGSIFLALSFGKLSTRYTRTGGPYEYSRLAFGEPVGFMSAWLYWNGSWIGNAAVIIAVTSYTAKLIPALGNSNFAAFIYSSIVLWIFTIINILGVKRAGKIQTAITVFEVALFVFFIIITAFHFDFNNLLPLVPEGKGLNVVPTAASYTLWAFVGLESATITAGEIKDPERNVRKSTIYGILIAAGLYMCINVFAMGAMSQEALAKSTAPVADILAQYFGTGITTFITISIVISILGTTVGWLLSTARVAYIAGEDGMFPEVFAKIHPKFQTPHMALIIGSILVNILLAMNYNKSLSSAFNFIILLATLSFLPIYAMTAASEIQLLVKGEKDFNVWKFIKSSFVPLIGFTYAVWTIYGAGKDAVLWGFILILAGIPVYLYMSIKKRTAIELTTDKVAK